MLVRESMYVLRDDHRGYRVKGSHIMIGEGKKGGCCYSQNSRKGNITYFCERTGRIFSEDIKVRKLYGIRKDFCIEPGITFSSFTYV